MQSENIINYLIFSPNRPDQLLDIFVVMGYIEKNGHHFTTGLDGQPDCLVLTGNDLMAEVDYIINNAVSGIYLNQFDSKCIKDLSFLESISFIEKVNIANLALGYSSLIELSNLKVAITSVNRKDQRFDYSKLDNLEILSTDWYPGFPVLLGNSSLRELYLWKYKPRTQNFEGLNIPANLVVLHILKSDIRQTLGLTSGRVRNLQLHDCSKLESLNDLPTSIESLVCVNCKALESYVDLENLINLKTLSLHNCGDIPNLTFLSSILCSG
ncbi:hypothetical protein MUK70_08495 [Dyadobacter chenwenxiniae]|uniref:Uncharacterized protein n=1 Tax=Dyadobacter chenwenxiniae TaxID=2906456 RepID=A0A9X1TFB5_9BACT|nr:hypothetical protein [Dyadobacter chenwenxiniae]MCF0062802.1 hypothetical protein [Dyadobacter chenwenxiniae]UON85023.1 hypothetical protein MUK70_08495 [Dyadobacter chenwenxiniae]